MTLTVWLHITNACNLDCPYCYVRKSSEAMDLEVGIRSLDRVMGAACQHGFRKVKIKYAGGEATLHFHRIQQLHAYATQKAQELGLKLEEVILSNGTILQPEDADWIAAEGIQVMISLDGIGEQHD
ncbi:MAG: radical SAM protein, partial [Thermoflexus sp.]